MMKTSTFFRWIHWLSALSFFLIAPQFFTSCASQNQESDETAEALNAENPEGTSDNLAELGDLKDAPPEQKPEGAATDPPPAPADGELTQEQKDLLAGTTPSGVAGPTPAVDPATPAPTTELVAVNEQAAKIDAAPVEEIKAPAVESVPAPLPTTVSKKKRGKRKPIQYTLPEIPTEALNKDGVLLNRFYMVRKGDSPERLSELLYGVPTRNNDLLSWNAKDWKPGEVLFYQSPSQPEDREMRSFFQERNVPPERYQLRKRDTLLKLAKQKLGSQDSWKEIALVNGLTNPVNIEPGQTIALYPSDLSSFNYRPSETAKKPPGESTEAPPASVELQPPAEAPKAEITEGEEKPATKGDKKGGLDINKLVEQNMLAILVGAGALVLLLAYKVVSKKKQPKGGAADDEADEDEGQSTQSRRR